MIQIVLQLKTLPKELDATDGIAVAICHFFQNSHEKTSNYTGWKDFLKNNPQKSS